MVRRTGSKLIGDHANEEKFPQLREIAWLPDMLLLGR